MVTPTRSSLTRLGLGIYEIGGDSAVAVDVSVLLILGIVIVSFSTGRRTLARS